VRIFLAGASGAIGRPLVAQLVEAGHEVVGMTRSNAGAITATGGEPAIADALDADAVHAAVEKARPDVVVNELTDLARPLNPRRYDEWLAGTNRLRREGTKNLVDAAQAVGATKFISQSVAFAYRLEPGLKTEDSPLIGAAGGEMNEAISDLEQLTLAAPGGIVLRYGFFYGPGTAYSRKGQQADMIRARKLPIVGDGRGVFPFIHVDDAASATLAAIERGAPGTYNIVDDDPAPAREWMPLVAELIGAKKPRRVPAWLARLVAGRLAEGPTKFPPVSNAKAKAQLGWQPRYPSWRDGFRAEFG
jgi:nucleoside-diphosphate-sugar epimerase